jgi:hypothetical protein
VGGHAIYGINPRRRSPLMENIFSGSRLHQTRETGHFPFALTRAYRVRGRYGSRVRLPGLRQRDYSRPRLVSYLLYEQLQGVLSTAYKISQAFPVVPGPRYACW